MKSNTNELRKQLKTIFNEISNNVSYEQAPTPLNYPYTIFELSEITSEDGKTLYKLEVNCIDRDNVNRVEQIADDIQDRLDHLSFINEKISFEVYRGQRNKVDEEDKRIKRRLLTFELHFYSKEV